MVLVSSGAALNDITLADGYLVGYSKFETDNGSLTLISFHRNNERLKFCFASRVGQMPYETWITYSDSFGNPRRTKEWFVERLMEHPPLFEWFLWNP